jgi:hypothetical protein
MAVALFFETATLPEGRPQYIVLPTQTGAVVLSRVSDGGRKGRNVWAPGVLPAPNTALVREPSALVVSAVDEAQFAARGVPTNLATKALAANEKSPVTTLTVEDLGDIVGTVMTGDPSLNQWVRDGRRKNPVTSGKSVPVTVTVAPASSPAPATVSQPVTQTAPASDTSRAMAFVPDISVAKRYIHREVRGVLDFEVFDHAAKTGQCIALYGPTGSAKTTCALAWSAQRGRKVAMVSGNVTLEPSQIFGQYIYDETTGGLRWQDGIVTEVVRDGGTLVLDEINFIPGKIATVLFPLLQSGTRHITLLDHGGETIKAHPDLVVFATWNPRYAGTLDLNAALRNRFALQVEWGYDEKVEKALVKSKSLREFAAKLRAAEASEQIYTPTPTNALVEFEDLVKALGLDFAIGNFLDRYEDDEKAQIRIILSDLLRDGIGKDLGVIVAEPEPEVVEATVSDADALRTLADLNL